MALLTLSAGLNCMIVHSLTVQPGHAAMTMRPTRHATIAMGPKKAGGKRVKSTPAATGFGAKKAAPPERQTVSADKASLERQWDRFVSITDLDILPRGDDEWRVADVYVRNSKASKVCWWRIGKVVADGVDVQASLRLQKGLILWTAVHMRQQLMVAGGLASAVALELGYSHASMLTSAEQDGPVELGELEVEVARSVPVKGISLSCIGFRPDYNPPGFAYKRRERVGGEREKERKKRAAAGMSPDVDAASGEWDPLGLEAGSTA